MAKQPAKGRKPAAKQKKTTQSRRTSGESAKAVKPMVDAIPAEVHKKSATNIQKTDIQKPVPSKSDAPAPDLKKPDVQPNKAPVQQQPPVVAKPKSTFVPLVFGGVIAGAIGFAIASTMATSDNGMLSDPVSYTHLTLPTIYSV